jgi:linoleoyl-CoA desaturase
MGELASHPQAIGGAGPRKTTRIETGGIPMQIEPFFHSRPARGPEPDAPVVTEAASLDVQRRPRFPKDEGFQTEVRRRVAAYFKDTGRSERDCPRMYVKTMMILGWWAASYMLLVFVAASWWQALIAAVSLVLAMAAIGFSIQHDGGHQAYSRRSWINKLSAMSLDLIGASSYCWYWKHAVLHHTYPNITEADTDMNTGGIARLTPHQPRRWFHRWQHLYLWPLYGISAMRWHLYGDFKDVITGTIGDHRVPRPKGWDLAVFIGGKVASIGLLLVLPMFWHPWWVVLLFYTAVTCMLGVVLSVVFQLAHCVNEAEFPMPDSDTSRMDRPWAVHQVETTVDFARRSRVLTWLLGGLNFQIEHHLFPRVCHVHYPAIAPIVEATCNEFGVRYTAHTTFWGGIVSHYRWLWRMGHAERV